jgi:hypothetical protein
MNVRRGEHRPASAREPETRRFVPAGRRAARLPAAELLRLPVGAQNFAVAGEDDADRRVVEQRALIEEHAGELLLRLAAASDVAQGPDRLHRFAGGAERLTVDRAPEGGAVAAADLELGVPGLAARRLGPSIAGRAPSSAGRRGRARWPNRAQAALAHDLPLREKRMPTWAWSR